MYNSKNFNLFPLVNGKGIEIETVYADPAHPENFFVSDHFPLYQENAPILLHPKLLEIIRDVAGNLPENFKLRVYDGYRPPEAQEKMQSFKQKLKIPNNMLADPGKGGHPRGAAVDCAITLIHDSYAVRNEDYGTGFDDFLIDDDAFDENGEPLAFASRNYRDIGYLASGARLRLEAFMQAAALRAGTILCPLPSEWWDFRFPANQTDLKYVLASFNRILFNEYGAPPDVSDYEGFVEYWRERYATEKIPVEKKFIFGSDFRVPNEENLIYSDDLPVFTEKDANKAGFFITR